MSADRAGRASEAEEADVASGGGGAGATVAAGGLAAEAGGLGIRNQEKVGAVRGKRQLVAFNL